MAARRHRVHPTVSAQSTCMVASFIARCEPNRRRAEWRRVSVLHRIDLLRVPVCIAPACDVVG